MKKIETYIWTEDGMQSLETGNYVRYSDHIAAMNTCVKCGQTVTDWDEHIMTCEKSPAVKRIKELEEHLEYEKMPKENFDGSWL